MEKSAVDLLIETLAYSQSQRFSDLTPTQLQAYCEAFKRLLEESSPQHAVKVLTVLINEIDLTQSSTWEWLVGELYFEAYALALDDRVKAALHFLQNRPETNDHALDGYNARLNRFLTL